MATNSIEGFPYFLRCSPFLFGISSAWSSGSTTTYKVAVSISGSEVVIASFSSVALIKPKEVRFSSHDKKALTPMLWYGGQIDDSAATSAPDLATSLQTLGMLYTHFYLVSPIIIED